MSFLYLDTSALLKAIVPERGSDALNSAVRAADGIATSRLVIPEAESALNRLLREGKIDKARLERLRGQVFIYLGLLKLLSIDNQLLDEAAKLIQRHVDVPIRTLDSLHIATARRWRRIVAGSVVLASSDQRLLLIAQAEGFAIFDPRNPHPNKNKGTL